jgi:hypothetical protein
MIQDGANGTSADDVQFGGDHYKTMPVQPWHVMEAVLTYDEFVGFLKGNIIKYSMRQGKKDSPDAEKCQHYIKKLQEVIARGSW